MILKYNLCGYGEEELQVTERKAPKFEGETKISRVRKPSVHLFG